MRTLRVVITMVGGVPLLTATLAPSGCGSQPDCPDGSVVDSSLGDVRDARQGDENPFSQADASEAGPDTGPAGCGGFPGPYIVPLPPPGVPAEPGQLCAVTPPVTSNTAARVTFHEYDPQAGTATGYIALSPSLTGTTVGLPTVTVTGATDPQLLQLQVSAMAQIGTGAFTFKAKWPAPHQAGLGLRMTVKTSLTVKCGDGGTEVVESSTEVDYCIDTDRYEWVSSGDECTVCTIIAEMAPSPIVSDIRNDDLPLAQVIRVRVHELARAGRTVLLMVENDAGEEAEYEWRTSAGRLETVAPDIVLWTLPDDVERPFGQVAVWNDDGAVVENFLWGAA